MSGEHERGESCSAPEEIVEAFETAILATGRSRIERRQLWALWDKADTAWAGSPQSRSRLSSALTALAADGAIELPARSGTLWDSSIPPIPARIAVPANKRTHNAPLDPATEPWTPRMSWAPAWIKTNRPPQRLRVAAAQVNRWLLATTGMAVPHVAREERSLHIFNDEKRLALLAASALFEGNRLTLNALSCDPPLGALRVAVIHSRGPVLVVENKSTFDSAWRAQKAAANDGYAAIVFGGGDAAPSLLLDLHELPATLGVMPTVFEYAGDVDVAGVEAAAAFSETLTSAGLAVRMAHPLWDAVARAQPTGEDLTADRARSVLAAQSAQHLGLPCTVVARLREGVRVPQERIDRTEMADVTWWLPETTRVASQALQNR